MIDEVKTARIQHLVTDMGNGGAYCDNCWTEVDPKEPTKCTKCDCVFVGSNISNYNYGGSDF